MSTCTIPKCHWFSTSWSCKRLGGAGFASVVAGSAALRVLSQKPSLSNWAVVLPSVWGLIRSTISRLVSCYGMLSFTVEFSYRRRLPSFVRDDGCNRFLRKWVYVRVMHVRTHVFHATILQWLIKLRVHVSSLFVDLIRLYSIAYDLRFRWPGCVYLVWSCLYRDRPAPTLSPPILFGLCSWWRTKSLRWNAQRTSREWW